MPRFISKSDSTRGQNLLTFDTFCGNFVLKTGDAVNIFIIGNYEGLGSNLKDKWNYEMEFYTNFFSWSSISPTLVAQTLQWKQVSCHWCPLYSIFLVPARKVLPHPSHLELISCIRNYNHDLWSKWSPGHNNLHREYDERLLQMTDEADWQNTCRTGNKLHASGDLCSSYPDCQDQSSCHTCYTCWQSGSHSTWYTWVFGQLIHIFGRSTWHHNASNCN